MQPESSAFGYPSKVGSGDTPPPFRKKRKVKLQVPKWIPPEKRMKKYRKNMRDASKVPFTKFMIVVPTQEDKEQLEAGFEYIHDNNSVMDNDFIVINQIAHSYLTPEREEGVFSCIVVDPKLFRKLAPYETD